MREEEIVIAIIGLSFLGIQFFMCYKTNAIESENKYRRTYYFSEYIRLKLERIYKS